MSYYATHGEVIVLVCELLCIGDLSLLEQHSIPQSSRLSYGSINSIPWRFDQDCIQESQVGEK